MHKLYNIIQVAKISDIFFEDTLDRFIISPHLPFKISNSLFTYIMVEDWKKI